MAKTKPQTNKKLSMEQMQKIAKEAQDKQRKEIEAHQKELFSAKEDEVLSFDDARKQLESKTNFPIKLPSSGLVVILRLPSMSKLVRDGSIPKHLMAVAMNVSGGGSAQDIDPEQISKFYELIDNIVCKTIVKPKFSMNPSPENSELDIALLNEEDKNIIWSLIQGGVPNLAKFR